MEILIVLIFIAIIAADFFYAIIAVLCKCFTSEDTQISAKEALSYSYSQSFLLSRFNNKKHVKFKPTAGYGLIILGTILLTLGLYHVFSANALTFLASLAFGYALFILTVVDIRTQYLPDIITKPLIFWGIVQSFAGIFSEPRAAILGAVLGYGVFWGINAAFVAIRHKQGMGGGDFKLLAAIGAWTGYMNLPLVIFLASVLGLIGALITAPLVKKSITEPLPFGPYLAISGLIALCYGETIINFYISLY